MLPFRSDAGFSNHGPGEPLFGFGLIDASKFHCWFSDFHQSEGITASTAGDWTVTKVGGSAVALADADGGVLAITNAGADNDNTFIQKLGESFKWAPTKKLAIMLRFKVTDATQSDLAIGLQITDTAPLDVTDGIFFYKADGSAVLTARVEKDDVAATGDVVTMANDAYVDVAIVYQGRARIAQGNPNTTYYDFETFYKDSGGVWRQAGTIAASTEAPDDEELTVSFGVQNGDGVTPEVLSIDYALFCRER